MRHIFIINPVAGKGKHVTALIETIHTVCKEKGADYGIYITKAVGDAAEFVKSTCEAGGETRFYACGGDGTLSEVVAGAYGYSNAQVAVVPCGTGNDFVRSFAGVPFHDIAAQLAGDVHHLDLIKTNHGICTNLCSIGFDSAVCMNMVRYKKMPLVTGSMAYIMAIIQCFFFQRLGNTLTLTIDGETLPTEDFAIGVCGNGMCYGGGFYAAPRASLEDGLLEIVMVRKINRARFLKLIGTYKNGKHLDDKNFSDVVFYTRARSLHISSAQDAVVNYDGECEVTREMSAEVLPGAIAFSLPLAHVKGAQPKLAGSASAKGIC
ncbi:diacylglycerol/lipid kinase family protein [Acetanaerobacterium elongatum]|uniref:Lipid kinase, YegS/Rv2252/BmrU family n=1 Tax=Acetanaerobacterium elongatum TaxID=258515 RepID=A0A1G9ZS45_9FIRM|nr:diacylglycerol kinase family protein [Acetanaerobacterium elongatum]SDN24432.1 lipid kinase, YegS/Rv2252/BmrU family [Acetanaerobacterium elongatum]